MNKKILLIVDPQYDFMDGGNLPVVGSTVRMDALASYLKDNKEYSQIIITADWHPFTHCSFDVNGGEWPMHCVDHTLGASIYNPIMMATLENYSDKTMILNKGTNKDKEEYSIVQNTENGKKLLEFLADENPDVIDVCGIVSTVCVQNTIDDLCEFNWGDKLNVLIPFTASFSEEDENKFIKWLENNKIKYQN